jgi:hypothetical protein
MVLEPGHGWQGQASHSHLYGGASVLHPYLVVTPVPEATAAKMRLCMNTVNYATTAVNLLPLALAQLCCACLHMLASGCATLLQLRNTASQP